MFQHTKHCIVTALATLNIGILSLAWWRAQHYRPESSFTSSKVMYVGTLSQMISMCSAWS